MSSIEKAIERLIAKQKQDGTKQSLGKVEDQNTPDENDGRQPARDNRPSKAATTANRVSEPDVVKVKTTERAKRGTRQNGSAEKRICNLDFQRLDKSGFLVPDTSHLRLAEEYRVIKRPVLMNAFNKGAVPIDKGNLVVVTSAVEGEGKTYTALNLAMSIGLELDCTVLLVDADIIMRSLTKTLGLEKEKGLVDILHDRNIDLSDLILATNIDRVKILPAGSLTKNSTELLASSRMATITSELSQRYSDRVILFDSPPVLAATETLAIIHHMGQVIVVVESSRTPTDVIESCVEHIGADKVIGMVLNKSRFHGKTGYYGGYGIVE